MARLSQGQGKGMESKAAQEGKPERVLVSNNGAASIFLAGAEITATFCLWGLCGFSKHFKCITEKCSFWG